MNKEQIENQTFTNLYKDMIKIKYELFWEKLQEEELMKFSYADGKTNIVKNRELILNLLIDIKSEIENKILNEKKVKNLKNLNRIKDLFNDESIWKQEEGTSPC